MVRFSSAQVAEVVQPFWAALAAGQFISEAAVGVGTYRKQGTRWGRGVRRGASPSWTRAQRAVFDLSGARGDRAGPRRWGDGSGDRSAAGTCSVNGVSGTASQR